MCGRFTLAKPERVAPHFEIVEPKRAADLPRRYNIAPTQPVAVVHAERGRRQLTAMRWGLIPDWKKPEEGGRTPAGWFNARAETAAEKPAFRAAFKRGRCLVPADGFYEWQKVNRAAGGTKQPYYIRPPGGEPLAFAAIHGWWAHPDGSELPTVAVLTTRPNAEMAELHDRMPVLIDPPDFDRWLGLGRFATATENPGPPDVGDLLGPAPDGTLEPVPVSPRVGNVRNDDAALIAPLTPPGPATLFG